MDDSNGEKDRIEKLEEELQKTRLLVAKLEQRIEALEISNRKGGIGGILNTQPTSPRRPRKTPQPPTPDRDIPPPPKGPEIG